MKLAILKDYQGLGLSAIKNYEQHKPTLRDAISFDIQKFANNVKKEEFC